MKQHWYFWIISHSWMAIVPFNLVLGLAPRVAQAQLVATAQPTTILRVQPLTGRDQGADGSDRAPFKTITHALQVATTNTVILLAPGTYSTSSGEQFPLQLKPGVTVQGTPQTFGQEVVIQGGGVYASPSLGSQTVAIVGANQAGLVGVTVTNPQGQGVWVESSSPMLLNNTLTGNPGNAVAIVGNSAPLLRYNQLSRNGVGVSVVGMAHPEIRENLLEQLGTGIWIQPTATPTVIGNLLRQNQADVVSLPGSPAVLQGNRLESTTAAVAPVAPVPQESPTIAPPAIVNVPSSASATAPKIPLPAIAAAPAPLAPIGQPAVDPGASSVEFPVPAVLGSSVPVQPATLIIEPAPDRYQARPPVAAPVPAPIAAPAMDSGAEVAVTIPVPLPDSSSSAPMAPTIAAAKSLAGSVGSVVVQYRVVVNASDEAQVAHVRSLMPQAFELADKGRMVMQVGAFGDLNRAQQLVETLVSQGLQASVETLR